MERIDLENYHRKEHFEFFSEFDDPFFGLVTEIECTKLLRKCKTNNHSFFANYLHKALKAANLTEAFHLRKAKNQIEKYDTVHASPTLGREDGSFAFGFIHYHTDPLIFEKELNKEIEAVKKTSGLRLNDDTKRKDVIHFSAIPWTKFTGISHAKNLNTDDSIPKISFGKYFERSGKIFMNISVDAHHGLADARDVAVFLRHFQKLLGEN